MTTNNFNSSNSRFLTDLNENDAEFLENIMQRFPHVGEGFTQFANTPPFQRISLASDILNKKPRAGWLRFGVEIGHMDILGQLSKTFNKLAGNESFLLGEAPHVTETILQHCIESAELYSLLYACSRVEINRQWGFEIMKFHDFQEAIMGDFTPKDDITKAEKNRLEKLALELLTESRHSGNLMAAHIYNCVRLFEKDEENIPKMQEEMISTISKQKENGETCQNQRFLAILLEYMYAYDGINDENFQPSLKDCDVLQMAFRGLRIMRENHYKIPRELAEKEMQQSFWNSIDTRIQTPEARCLFDTLNATTDKHPDMKYRDVINIAFDRYFDRYEEKSPTFTPHHKM